MDSIIDLIRKRSSVRSYSQVPVEEEKKERIKEILRLYNKGPFGNNVRFELLDLNELERSEVKNLGTYGVIKGARLFIAGAVKDTYRAFEDYGYCLEKVILELTGMGIVTCWLGGTFNRTAFTNKLGLLDDETIPAITPVGYAAEKRSIMDSLMKIAARSGKRKEWKELFFDGEPGKPLTEGKAGGYSVCIESVRLGPSAKNGQPWRIIKEEGKDVFHFYINKKNDGRRGYKNIDAGIAMCHFELSAAQLDLKGSWEQLDSEAKKYDMEYIATWVGR